MTWVRFDDQYPHHRKVAPLNDRQYRLANEAIFWCSRNTTDGRIRTDELMLIRSKAKPSDAAELVRRGIWHEAGHVCPNASCPPSGDASEGGWVVHDYWDYQPSREKVEKDRAAKTQRQQRWRDTKTGNYARSPRSVDASRDASRDVRVDASRDASVDAAPSRPAPNKAGRGDPPRALDDRRQAADAAADERTTPMTHRTTAPAMPPDLSLLKAKLASDARKLITPKRTGAFEELRNATGPVSNDVDA